MTLKCHFISITPSMRVRISMSRGTVVSFSHLSDWIAVDYRIIVMGEGRGNSFPVA